MKILFLMKHTHTLYTMYLHKPNSTVVSPAGRLRNLLCHIMVTAFFQYQTKTKLVRSLSLSILTAIFQVNPG